MGCLRLFDTQRPPILLVAMQREWLTQACLPLRSINRFFKVHESRSDVSVPVSKQLILLKFFISLAVFLKRTV